MLYVLNSFASPSEVDANRNTAVPLYRGVTRLKFTEIGVRKSLRQIWALGEPQHHSTHVRSEIACSPLPPKPIVTEFLISFHLAVWLTTGPKPLPKWAVHIMRSRASSFKWEYPLLSLRSSSSFLRLLPRLPVTSILPFIFPSFTCCRRQFLRKMWPIQLTFRLLISCRIFLCSLTLSNTFSFLTW